MPELRYEIGKRYYVYKLRFICSLEVAVELSFQSDSKDVMITLNHYALQHSPSTIKTTSLTKKGVLKKRVNM